MEIATPDGGQRKAARAAALAWLLSTPLVVFANFAVIGRLSDGAARDHAAQSIAAAEVPFRFGIACELVYAVGLVVLAVALYRVLRPAGPGMALMALAARMVDALMWVLITLDLFAAVRLATRTRSLAALPADRTQELLRVALTLGWDQYYVGLVFWALASTLCAILWLRSGFVPRALAWSGIVISAWSGVCALGYLIWPRLAKVVDPAWYDSLLAVFELAISVWLLARGLAPSPAPRSAPPAPRADSAR